MKQQESPFASFIPFLIIPLLIETFFLGVLWTKVQYFEKGGAVIGNTNTTTADEGAAAQPAPAKPSADINTIKALFTEKNLFVGDKNSKNLFVEVADPSCPYCHVAAGHNPELNTQMGTQFTLASDGGTYVAPVPEMKKMVDEGNAAFVWIYTRGHGNGDMGTKAMYCAHEQGKFWEVHDKLMTNESYDLLNDEIKNNKEKSQELADFLSGVFDPTAMKTCLDSGKYDKQLNDDVATALKLGITGTPGFYVNTTPFEGAYSWKDMESALK